MVCGQVVSSNGWSGLSFTISKLAVKRVVNRNFSDTYRELDPLQKILVWVYSLISSPGIKLSRILFCFKNPWSGNISEWTLNQLNLSACYHNMLSLLPYKISKLHNNIGGTKLTELLKTWVSFIFVVFKLTLFEVKYARFAIADAKYAIRILPHSYSL